jgi:tetratricopeptide (TPR) repeat protein
MRHAPITWGAAILTAFFCAAWASAEPRHPPDRHPPPGGNHQRPPQANGQVPHLANQNRPHQADHRPDQGPNHGHRSIGGYLSILDRHYAYVPFYGGDCYLNPYFYPPSYYGGYVPPAFLTGDPWLGAMAMPGAFGIDPRLANANVFARPRLNDRDVDDAEPRKSADRSTNAQAVVLALKFIGYGDALFVQQKYAEANDRYRKAATSAPQLADPWFRQGFALAATGRYELAQNAFKRGLKLNPKWPKSGFDLDELYGPNAITKTAQLDAMANTAEENPNDAGLLFLIGVRLHFDGQADRAKVFFQRAAQLVGGDENAEHVRAFLRNDK